MLNEYLLNVVEMHWNTILIFGGGGKSKHFFFTFVISLTCIRTFFYSSSTFTNALFNAYIYICMLLIEKELQLHNY